jgi:hypothetical protein
MKAADLPATTGLNARQVALLAAVRDFAMSRYSCPVFGEVGPKASDTHAVQIRLEERMFPGYMNDGERLFVEFNAAMAEAFAAGHKQFVWPLRLTAFRGAGEMLVPVTITRSVYERVRRNKAAAVAGVCLVIGPGVVEVRVTMRRPRMLPDIARRKTFSDADWQKLAEALTSSPP